MTNRSRIAQTGPYYFRLVLPALLLTALCRPLPAQIGDPASDELLEAYFRDNDQAAETEAQQVLEYLEHLRAAPLDLNEARREDLAALRVLNPLQIEQLIAYRARLGPLLSPLELQAVPGWEAQDIRRLLPYVRAGAALDRRSARLWPGLYRGDDEVIGRWSRSWPPPRVNGAEGGPFSYALRWRHGYDNRLRYGFTAENDAGEAFFGGSNRHGFDFYSAHLFVQNANSTLTTLALGDYSARFGQGLLLQTGFSPGKSAETTTIVRGARRLSPYASFGEAYFFRGAAATLAFGDRWQLTALYSNRHRDANVVVPDSSDLEFEEITFTSLQSSGLHRTLSEISDEKSLNEQAVGLSAGYAGSNLQVHANGLRLRYEQPWQPAEVPYRRFVFRGRRLTGFSVDYQYHRRNWYLFGETARSDNGAVATVNGLLLTPDRHLTLSLLHRALPRHYQSVYAAPFAEASGAANEQGLYLGADFRLVRRWQINAYADLWRHPWLRFGVGGPSQGREFLARLMWTRSRTFSTYLLWQSETKQRDGEVGTDGPGLVEQRRDRLRLHAAYRVLPELELRSRLEWTTVMVAGRAGTRGFLAYQEAVFRPLGFPLFGSLRYALFDTDDFDSRVFAFENDLFAALSIPAYSGQGQRYYLNLSWRVNRWLRLESRYEETLLRRAVTGTGMAGRQREVKVQVRCKF